jgi:hypothetical protein
VGGTESGNQEISEYFSRGTSPNLLTQNLTDWGSKKQENTPVLNYTLQEILAPAGNNYSI